MAENPDQGAEGQELAQDPVGVPIPQVGHICIITAFDKNYKGLCISVRITPNYKGTPAGCQVR
jgi:hypothetical protein